MSKQLSAEMFPRTDVLFKPWSQHSPCGYRTARQGHNPRSLSIMLEYLLALHVVLQI